jgi:Flp pilus assembly pilin Flp
MFSTWTLKVIARLARDESGGEALEYAIIAGLVVVTAIMAITAAGTKALARWTSLNSNQ